MNDQKPPGRVSRLPGLDGLRGIACLMVFAVHFGQLAKIQGQVAFIDIARLFENGNSGVALLFVLSGFLLSLPYWHAIVCKEALPRFTPYLRRRMVRIVPAYFVCLTGLIVLNKIWYEEDWLLNAALHYAFVFNFTNETIFSINPPFWTIAVEFQFYLLLPIIFLVVGRLRTGLAALSIALLAVVFYGLHFGLSEYAVSNNAPGSPLSPVITYSLLAHLPHFLFGVVSAWLFATLQPSQREPSDKIHPFRELSLWIGFALVVVILGTQIDDSLQIPFGRYNLPFVPLLFCVVILLTPLTATGLALFQGFPLGWIGTVSYGVYIYHLPILHVVARLMPNLSLDPHDNWIVFGGLSSMTTLVVASLSYYMLERPLLRFGRKG